MLKSDKVGMVIHVDVQGPDKTMIRGNTKEEVKRANVDKIKAWFGKASGASIYQKGIIKAIGI